VDDSRRHNDLTRPSWWIKLAGSEYAPLARVQRRARGRSGAERATAQWRQAPIGVGGHDGSVELSPSSVAAWAGVELRDPLTGGARNPVVRAERGSERLVVRRSGRPVAALEWELNLLEFLDARGIEVPRMLRSDDGRRHVDGVLIYRFIDGRPPGDRDDWRRVVAVLTAVHEMTTGWPQRPGFASSRQLLIADRGGDVRLDAMPIEAVDAVRAAWRPIVTGTECVNHGDVGGGNILVTEAGIALLDWDESRVDVPWFDFAFLPPDVEADAPVDAETLSSAGVAWEAATCWMAEPDYAAKRLAELQARIAVKPQDMGTDAGNL
jgi:aminoglycoside phosphotransferase (APT) family kinase protein